MLENVFPYIGEALLERILNEDKSLIAGCLNVRDSDIKCVHRQLPLEFKGSSVIFDGYSTLDLGILLVDDTILPVEVKLGYSGLARASVNKMLAPCTVSAHKSENRVSGKILSIINGYFDSSLTDVIAGAELCARIDGTLHPLTTKWGIVARDSVLKSWSKLPPEFNGLHNVVSIEEVCSTYGERRFNALVGEFFSGINFYKTWL